LYTRFIEIRDSKQMNLFKLKRTSAYVHLLGGTRIQSSDCPVLWVSRTHRPTERLTAALRGCGLCRMLDTDFREHTF